MKRIKEKSGFFKIVKACRQAVKHGFQWIWVDTVCIDKTSSAELSEAINSMYQWYELSDICFVYLEDVPPVQAKDGILTELATENSRFRRSRWFTREAGRCKNCLLLPNCCSCRKLGHTWGLSGALSLAKVSTPISTSSVI